ncbi:hypothetical protein SDC9_124836 [bioreactor metagenome]|uniref:DUF2971 domain-containing protein n=1 Tax=bioreactor metagenome TaxID=1076179 RepID=A0A645CLP2_9ZZZZ
MCTHSGVHIVLSVMGYNKKMNRDFEKYIMGLVIPEEMNPQDETKKVSELHEYCRKQTPQNLFRYRTCSDYHIKAFDNCEVWLTKPTMFNDPHDSYLYINKNEILDFFVNGMSKSKSFTHIQNLLNNVEYKEEMIEKCGAEFVEQIIRNATINGKPIELTDYEIEFQKKFYSRRIDLITKLCKESIKESALVGCFSESVESTLMWSHYADNHKGFALNYNFQELYSVDIGKENIKGSLFINQKLFPVIYSKNRYDATKYLEFHFMMDMYRLRGITFNDPFYDKLFYYKWLLFKSLDWSYEREWRIIKLMDNNIEHKKPDYACIPSISPKEIYLGAEISKENQVKLTSIARKKGIRIFKMEIADDEKAYKLNSVEI